MNLARLFSYVRARRSTFLITLVLFIAAATALTWAASRNYRASATVIINMKGVDPLTGQTLPVQLIPGFIANQLDIIRSTRVALHVVDDLKLTEHPWFRQQVADASLSGEDLRLAIAYLLMMKLDVNPAREGSVVELTYRHRDPHLATDVTNAFVAAYQRSTVDLKSEPLRETAGYLEQQLKVLRANLESAQQKIAQYAKDNDIVALDKRTDAETIRLNDLIGQLVTVQGQLGEASSRQVQAQSGAGQAQEVVKDTLIQAIKADIAKEEAKLSGISSLATPEHPRYQVVKAQIDKLRAELNRQVRNVAASVGGSAAVLERREAELRAAVDAQKERVATLNRAKDHFVVIEREAEAAQQAYDNTANRFNELNLESRSNQSDVAVIDWATLPTSPLLRNVLRIAIPLTLLGALLGAALAFLAEMRDRRVRLQDDLLTVASRSAIGVVEWGVSAAAPRGRLRSLSRPRLAAQ